MLRVILGLLILFPVLAGAEERSLRVARYIEDSAPWFFIAEDGSLAGAAVEMVELLAGEAGFTPIFLELPWSRGLRYLQSGEVDLVLHLSRTPEREGFIRFLGKMGEEQPVLLLGPGHGGLRFSTLDDLAQPGLQWGVEQDFYYSREFNARLESDAAFRGHFAVNAVGGHVNLDKVRLGWLTGLIGDRVMLGHALRQLPDGHRFSLATAPFFPKAPVYMGISRRLPEDRAARLQVAYDGLAGRGAFREVLARWGCLLPEEATSSP